MLPRRGQPSPGSKPTWATAGCRWIPAAATSACSPPPPPRGPAPGRRGPAPGAAEQPETQVGTERVRTVASYVERPVASVFMIADQSVPDAVSERMVREAQADQIDM